MAATNGSILAAPPPTAVHAPLCLNFNKLLAVSYQSMLSIGVPGALADMNTLAASPVELAPDAINDGAKIFMY